MKKIILIILLCVCLFAPIKTISGRIYLGIEGGGAVPRGYLNNFFAEAFQGGLMIETTTEIRPFFIQFKCDHYVFSNTTSKMDLTPLILNILIKTPWRYNLKPYFSAGGGITFEKLQTEEAEIRNIDPVLSAGGGIEYMFQTGSLILGPYMEGLYHFIYQKSQKAAMHNGEVMLLHLGMKFKIF
ncbi:MAG: hypothetical protein KKH98_12485 [Spirochaetes bacterium]|nr:hypothetical protein [Spirochaetota bacterium]